jgi:three-Cys-motif partner protein
VAERPWGFWTESKLDMLSDYLHGFNVASKKAGVTIYLDLFAGQAQNLNKHTGMPIDGSLRRALNTVPAFTALRGFEIRADRAASLQAAYQAQAPGRDVRIYPGDVHLSLLSVLDDLRHYRWAPTFAFLDPDGVEARWNLLEALAEHKRREKTKVEIFLLLPSAQFGRVVHEKLDEPHLLRAEQLLTDLFGCDQWRPILAGRRSGLITAEEARDEFTNLMRWRLERVLGYEFTHSLRLTNLQGAPIYDMVFATDHKIGDKIMSDVYRGAAARFPRMRREIRIRRREAEEAARGNETLIPYDELPYDDAPLRPDERYERLPISPPYNLLS